MRHRLYVHGALVALALLPARPATGVELAYRVACDSLASRTLHVELTVNEWPGGDLRFYRVPIYADNPTAAARDGVVRGLTARDAEGRPLAVRADTAASPPAFVVADAPARITIAYDLVVDYVSSPQTERYPVRIPFMGEERAWLGGNYVFCMPALAEGTRLTLSEPAAVSLVFDLPPEIPLVGPPPRATFPHLYALMSLQFGLGRYHCETGDAPGQPYELVFHDTDEFSEAERAVLHARTQAIIGAVIDLFGGAPFPTSAFYYYRRDGTGGLEGAYALQAYTRPQVDLTDPKGGLTAAFMETALHEYFHTWIPIGLPARDDMWWKEAVPCYYDGVLAARLGWPPADDWEQWLDRYDKLCQEDSLFAAVSLTDPRVWEHEYDSEAWRVLTYDRGLAVTLLLDVLLRDETVNARSLDDVLRRLFRERARAPFTHADLLAAIHAATGVDARAFFAAYIEGTELPTRDQLQAARAKAEEMGVFRPARPGPR